MTLTEKQLKELGDKICGILPKLEMERCLLNALSLAEHAGADKALLFYEMKQARTAILNQNNLTYQELDSIAYLLLNCDDPKAIQSFYKGGRKL